MTNPEFLDALLFIDAFSFFQRHTFFMSVISFVEDISGQHIKRVETTKDVHGADISSV